MSSLRQATVPAATPGSIEAQESRRKKRRGYPALGRDKKSKTALQPNDTEDEESDKEPSAAKQATVSHGANTPSIRFNDPPSPSHSTVIKPSEKWLRLTKSPNPNMELTSNVFSQFTKNRNTYLQERKAELAADMARIKRSREEKKKKEAKQAPKTTSTTLRSTPRSQDVVSSGVPVQSSFAASAPDHDTQELSDDSEPIRGPPTRSSRLLAKAKQNMVPQLASEDGALKAACYSEANVRSSTSSSAIDTTQAIAGEEYKLKSAHREAIVAQDRRGVAPEEEDEDKANDEEKQYCWCKDSEDHANLVCCDCCYVWYHSTCVKEPVESEPDVEQTEAELCDFCREIYTEAELDQVASEWLERKALEQDGENETEDGSQYEGDEDIEKEESNGDEDYEDDY